MKYAHFIEMRVFSREEDDEGRIRERIKQIFPHEKLRIDSSTVEGFENKKIRVLKVVITKNAEINQFLALLKSIFNEEQKQLLSDQLESRLDDSLHFYIRLEKDRLMDEQFEITEGGNCFHFKISMATYPHSREKAIELVKSSLGLPA
jgi:RNA binding exosome subunit